MTDEKKPPQEVDHESHKPVLRSVRSQESLIDKLYALDNAFGVATRAARASGEMRLMVELETRWDDYLALLAPLERVPPKLFE